MSVKQISQLRKRSNQFVSDLDLYQAEAIEMSDKEIVRLNQKQLKSSKLSTGQPIKPKYSKAYSKKKGYSSPDLFLTGELYKEMFVDVQENSGEYFVVSDAPHTKYPVAKYGKEVFGLTKESSNIVSPIAVTNLSKMYEKLVLK